MEKRANPLTVAVNIDGTTTAFSLPVTFIGTVVNTDGSQTLFNTLGTAIATLAIPPTQTLLVLPGQVITAAQGTFTGKSAASTATTAISTTSSSDAGTTNTATSNTATSTGATSGTAATTSPASSTPTAFTGTYNSTDGTFVYQDGPNHFTKLRVGGGNKSLPAGPAAGLAIGMLIAGALIAALVCFFLFSRRKKRNAAQAGHYEPTVYADERDLKHPTKITSTPMAAVGAAAIIENNLPQPKEDNAIIGDLSRIKSRIEGHVDSYYHTAGANNQAVAQALSAALGTAFPVSMAKLQELLSNPRKRPAVLRAAIAWIIVSRIDFGSGPDTTFLPAYVAGTTRDLSASRMDEPSEFFQSSTMKNSS